MKEPKDPTSLMILLFAVEAAFGGAMLMAIVCRCPAGVYSCWAGAMAAWLPIKLLAFWYKRQHAKYMGAASLLLLCLACQSASADCLVLVTAPAWCSPCRQMAPEVAAAKAAGIDIREVDMDKNPDLAKAYHVRCVPTTIYVHETPRGNFEYGRIEGYATAVQLRWLALAPFTATGTSAVRSAVRGLFSPVPVVVP